MKVCHLNSGMIYLFLWNMNLSPFFIEVFDGNQNLVIGDVYRVSGTDCQTSIGRYDEILNKLQGENK